MDKLARQVDIHHAVMQGSYFAGFSAIWGFGPVLLLYHGLSNSTLGVITSLALVLPAGFWWFALGGALIAAGVRLLRG